MHRLSAPPPVKTPRGGPLPKPSLDLPAKRLDEALVSILQQRKAEAGIFPGVPFN
jgi:hypothetical protein